MAFLHPITRIRPEPSVSACCAEARNSKPRVSSDDSQGPKKVVSALGVWWIFTSSLKSLKLGDLGKTEKTRKSLGEFSHLRHLK